MYAGLVHDKDGAHSSGHDPTYSHLAGAQVYSDLDHSRGNESGAANSHLNKKEEYAVLGQVITLQRIQVD